MVNFRDSYFPVQWDITKKHLSGSFWGKQYDTGRGFTVTVIDGGQVVTATNEVLRLKWEKPDKTTGYVNATIVNGKFVIENIDQMFTVAGSVQADFELWVAGEVVASVTFYVNVEKAVAVDAVASSSEFTALQTAIGTVDGLDAEMSSLQTNFNTFSSTLQSDFNSLETQFNNVIANVTVDSEVIAARGTEPTLGARLDSTDAELIDARIGANGVTYSSAGNAIREQINQLTNTAIDIKETLSPYITKADLTWLVGGISKGVYSPYYPFRICTELYTALDDITVYCTPGSFKYGIQTFTDGVYLSDSGWLAGATTIPSGTQFRLVCAKFTENTSEEISDVQSSEIYQDISISSDNVPLSELVSIKNKVDGLSNSNVLTNKLLSPKKPRFAMHRGFEGNAPQNTIPAFELAGKNKAFAIETDVYMTSDGYFVCYHDEDISTQTNAPVGTTITTNTLDTIRSYTITERTIGTVTYSGLKIPTLEEYLEICMLYGCVPLIEIKNIDKHYSDLYNIVKLYGFEDNCMFTNWEVYYLEIRNAIPDNVLMMNMKYDEDYITQIDRFISKGAKNVVFAFIWDEKATQSLVNYCHNKGFGICFWTINDEPSCIEAIKMGCDIITSSAIPNLTTIY